MADINATIAIIILSVKSFKFKRVQVIQLYKKARPNYMHLRDPPQIQNHKLVESKIVEKIHNANCNHKKVRVILLV